MSETGDYLRDIFNGEIPVKRKNPQTGETEEVYYNYDDGREELREAAVYPARATGRFYEPMAFASAQPEDEDSVNRRDEWRSLAHHNYNEDGSQFEMVMGNTLGEEGGYEDNPRKIEQPTNYGITQSTLQSYKNRHPDSGYPDHVRNLTVDQARNIYFQDYYQKYRIHNIKNDRLARIIFDMHAMTSPESVANIIQDGLIDSGYNVEKDGVFGSESIGALNAAANAEDTDRVAENIIRRRREFLNGRSNRDQYPGWFPRTNRY